MAAREVVAALISITAYWLIASWLLRRGLQYLGIGKPSLWGAMLVVAAAFMIMAGSRS